MDKRIIISFVLTLQFGLVVLLMILIKDDMGDFSNKKGV
jgi:hypothetical protein